VHHRDQLFLGQLEEAVARRRKSQHLEGPGHKTPLENPDFSNDRRGKKNKCRLPRLAEDTGSARVVFRWLEGSVWRRFHKKISMRRTVSIRWKFRLHVNGSGAHDAGRHTARLLSFNMNTLKVSRTCIHSLCPHATDLLHHNHQLEPQHRNFDG
jgi:hypothetical protein